MRTHICLLVAWLVLLGCQCKSREQAQGFDELAGQWRGWGRVVWNSDGSGSYTDTYGSEPGQMALQRVASGKYKGTWGESDKRHGTIEIQLSEDGATLTGTWQPDADCTIGGKTGGSIRWTRDDAD